MVKHQSLEFKEFLTVIVNQTKQKRWMQIGNYFMRIQLSIWTKKTIKINENLKKDSEWSWLQIKQHNI